MIPAAIYTAKKKKKKKKKERKKKIVTRPLMNADGSGESFAAELIVAWW